MIPVAIPTRRQRRLLKKHTKCHLKQETGILKPPKWSKKSCQPKTLEYRSSTFSKHKHAMAQTSREVEKILTSNCHFAAVNNWTACSLRHPVICRNWFIITCSRRLSIIPIFFVLSPWNLTACLPSRILEKTTQTVIDSLLESLPSDWPRGLIWAWPRQEDSKETTLALLSHATLPLLS